MDYSLCHLVPLNFESANTISNWKYDPPYSAYSFKGHSNEYLKRKENWGKEQFCMVLENEIIAQVACQQMDGEVWVGWSLNPALCGGGEGHYFVLRCLEELQKILKLHRGQTILLRVAEANQRAIRAYQKAGFIYRETIWDEIAYSNVAEPFWIMEKQL